MSKTPALKKGKVSIQPVEGIKGLSKFSGKTSAANAIIIESGVYDLHGVADAVRAPTALEKNDEGYLLSLPIFVSHGAGLIIRGDENNLLGVKLSQQDGVFIANAGRIFIIDAALSGWNENAATVARYEDKKTFRPFFVSWSGSETYFSRSAFRHMGYADSKSYGVTFSSHNNLAKNLTEASRPKGWLVDCEFEDLYYGFYSYEADDVAIIGNTYKDNIVYGIDPHDRSNRLIIAHNKAFGTKQRHGIIVSREVNDSWIVHNQSWGNGRSGIMLDRASINNVVAYNEVYKNKTDGIALYESPQNYIFENRIYENVKSGMKIRNSWDVFAWDNNINSNKVAVELYASDIESDTRDMELDPYAHKAGITLIGGEYTQNRDGFLNARDFDQIRLRGINAQNIGDRPLRGDISDLNGTFLSLPTDGMVIQPSAE